MKSTKNTGKSFTLTQTSQQLTNCQLYTDLYPSFSFIVSADLNRIASWRMYENACWYEAGRSIPYNSHTQFPKNCAKNNPFCHRYTRYQGVRRFG